MKKNLCSLDAKVLRKLKGECILEEEVQVQNYILNRKEQIIKQHVENVFPIKEPGERGGHQKYYMTKLTPHNRDHSGNTYGKTREELEAKILAYYLQIEDDESRTVREVLITALGGPDIENTKTKNGTGRRSLQRFDKHFPSLANLPLCKLDEKTLRAALDACIAPKKDPLTGEETKLTAKELTNALTSLHKLHSYCRYEHIDVCDITGIISEWRYVKLTGKHTFKDTTKRSSELAFSKEEAITIIKYALANQSYKSLSVAFLIVTGVRVSELLGLDTKDVYSDHVWIHKKEDTKTYAIGEVKENKSREIYFSEDAKIVADAFLEFRKNDSNPSRYLALNPNSDDGKMHIRALDDYIRTTIHEDVLGLDSSQPVRSLHDCRRTYASLESLNGTSIYDLRSQLGHKTVTQTSDYIVDVVDANTRASRLKGIGLVQ